MGNPAADIGNLWARYHATEARYNETSLLYDLVSGVATGIVSVVPGSPNDDYLSFARSGMDGSESYNRESLLARMSELLKQMGDLETLMEKQRLLAIKASRGVGVRRVGRGGAFWRGW